VVVRAIVGWDEAGQELKSRGLCGSGAQRAAPLHIRPWRGKLALPREAVATDEGQVEDVGVAGVESDGVVGIRELALDFQRCGEF
jgi:hypothetical protein